MKLILAESKTCGLCWVLNSKLKEANLKVKSVDRQTDFKFFKEHSITSVPRLLVFNNDNKIVERVQGIQDIVSRIKQG